ncbi:kinase-like protein [Patellaria atrata CBS 101060]|uniref:non-specific serine/threonine protein kinase n=1 Tax=Patellaria atrata CBS 101060 TaxID=1346257 RepID=A0A9P4S2B8_9PEZI|nr:kinase-like protein [Patellaria atrata CBS 101060]
MQEEQIKVLEDECREDEDTVMDESRGPLEESGYTRTNDSEEEEEEDVEDSVLEDIARFQDSFKGINKRYRLINRIGEGTFSTVYKAEDLHYHSFQNDWDIEAKENERPSSSPKKKAIRSSSRPRYVAIKKIYVTSSPIRILNELSLLHDLKASPNVCPLITAFRYQDQVVAILPYFQHKDFRDYFTDFTVEEMRLYFRSLFTALKWVHRAKILHRDIKPTNFLYSPQHSRGVLVDFGLAEREGTDWYHCNCEHDPVERAYRIKHSHHESLRETVGLPAMPSYPKNDQRPSRRANRAGTRGFRAPEVLLKCTAQTTAIDMWSSGVILLTFLSRRFPFFHSADDIDALLEITAIFGKRRMREVALLHGQVFQTNITSYSESGISFDKLILWCTNRNSGSKNSQTRVAALSEAERDAIKFLERCLECEPGKRITAEEALEHPFIAAPEEDDAKVESP